MSLSVGIVGLPNAGKSTLFNALAARRLAETAPRPFTTIEPHEAIVAVPDKNLEKLRSILVSQYPNIEVVPAVVTFIDIAGLVKGASKGEGLGNQFLAKIREVDAIVHVVRTFKNENVPHIQGKIDPQEDVEVVNLELELGGIKDKPVIYVYNCDEKEIADVKDGISVCAKLEEELSDLTTEEKKEYLKQSGITESGLEKLIRKAYALLGLITFYTIKPSSAKASEGRGGGNQVTAWSLKRGLTALDAAAEVHTDFAKNFIKAEVINVDKLLVAGGWKEAKEKGEVKLEGKDYLVEDKDVIEFKVGS